MIIPALEEAEGIGPAIAAVHACGLSDVVVSDGGSLDETVPRARAAGARVVEAPRGRAWQMNAGVAVARGRTLLFLHADTRLPTNAGELIRQALLDPTVLGGCFRLSFDRRHPMLGLSAWFSRFESYLTTFGDQAFFVRREAFERIGGFPQQSLMEDVAFRRRLLMLGRFVKLPVAVVTSARRYQRAGVVRQQLLNAMLLAGYAAGIPAERLARLYR